jgi:hypothetical protein
MITPDPVIMTVESGRLFEFELGRKEKIKKPQEDWAQPDVEEFEEKWVQYKFNQRKEINKD